MKFSSLIITLLTIGITITSCSQPSTEIASNTGTETDSTAMQMEADSIAADTLSPEPPAEPEPEPEPQIEFTEDGAFAIQVESWRSELSAQKRADYWKSEGYANAFVVRYGNEETGDVWFRVQLGQVNAIETAEELRKLLMEENQQPSWIVEMSSQ